MVVQKMTIDRNTQYVKTITGEFIQPVRVYYNLFNKNNVQKLFKRMRCMKFDANRNRWVWLYDGEAKKIKFQVSYRAIPRRARPIVLGSIFTKVDSQMHIDVRSIERATEAIEFFDNRIERTDAKVTDIAIRNSIISENMENPTNFDGIFDDKKIVHKNPEEYLEELENEILAITDKNEMMKALMIKIDKESKKSFPKVERMPTHFYEDGIVQLKLALQTRQNVAIEHWQGNESYSLSDVLKKMF